MCENCFYLRNIISIENEQKYCSLWQINVQTQWPHKSLLFRGITHTHTYTHTIDGNSKNSTLRINTLTSQAVWLRHTLASSAFLRLLLFALSPSTLPTCSLGSWWLTNALTAWIPIWTAAGIRGWWGHHRHKIKSQTALCSGSKKSKK